MNKYNLKPKHGIVAMIDALGIRNATIEESISFIKNIREVLDSLPSFMSGYLFESRKKDKLDAEPPVLTTFGDTFVFSWEMKEEELPDFLPEVGCVLSFAVLRGLQLKMALRGAMSVGNYIESGSTVLGPAIADAAAWYECPEMIGVIATPHCGSFLSEIQLVSKMHPMEFIQYAVPLKNSPPKNLWVTGWPEHLDLVAGKNEKEMKLRAYYKLLQKFSIPKGTEDKFSNSERFVHELLKIDFA